MATYFHGGSEIQANSDGIHTLYLMNPNYVPFSDNQNQNQTQTVPNMFFFNPPSHALNSSSLTHAPPSNNNHFLGIPLPANLNDHEISAFHHTMSAHPRLHYNLWGPVTTPEQTDAGNGISISPVVSPPTQQQQQQQGLSLSLSSQKSSLYKTLSAEQHDVQVPPPGPASGDDDVRASENSPTSLSVVSTGGVTQSVVLGSKYLKATQELLDEVVNVGKANKTADNGLTVKDKSMMKMKRESTAAIGGDGSANKQPGELSTAQRQDLQMKKAKLIGMLDEVDQKYRQYHQQMQGIVSSFEQAAGLGSAKSYASLALQTISKQFRCLKDAICSQIKATGKSLGEDLDRRNDDDEDRKVEGSRLRYVDHHVRQQRAMQQLGMIQHNTWRPQRGLPERAVSVLRAWLFEHFLHPYPKDSDKVILAKQTGLTRSQVSNWFINARVRLWKPMVEEMYLEEIKDQDHPHHHQQTPHGINKPESNNHLSGLESANTTTTSPAPKPTSESQNHHQHHQHHHQSKIVTENLMNNNHIHRDHHSLTDHHLRHHLISSSSMSFGSSSEREADQNNEVGGFGTYPIGEIAGGNSRNRLNNNNNNNNNDGELLTPRFHGNGVSLTLGLPHSNTDHHHHHQNYLSISNQAIQLGRSTGGTKRPFAAQLLPDFVA